MIRHLTASILGAPLLAVALTLTAPTQAQNLTVELVANGLARPLLVTSPPDDPRLFVLEQDTARIKIIENGSVLPTPFLDIGSNVSQGGERGLLGLAFHPDYASNGRFFVSYTNNLGDSRVREYMVSASDPNVADPTAVQMIVKANQPFSNHNGGMIEFGPDGMLYVGLGDGGSANDPNNAGQDLTTLLGKMLRLDVDIAAPFIPADNPFVGAGGGVREEIWAFGLRNPWRFSFDKLTGDMYIADVGQGSREEINFQPVTSAGGENYGWRCMEGTQCTGLSGCTCNDAALTMPIKEYGHGLGCSITGGYLYRGPITALQGTYFYADYCSDRIWSFRYDGGVISEFQERSGELDPGGSLDLNSISSFGQDSDGNLYICDLLGGEVWRIIEDCGGSNYCVTSPNSAGSGALITGGGSLNISDNAFELSASGSVPDKFGLFIYGLQPGQTPAGDGFLCLDGQLFRVLPPVQASGSGAASMVVDFTSAPMNGGPGQVIAGQTYYWQWWNRDPAAGNSGYNFSNGYSVIFCP